MGHQPTAPSPWFANSPLQTLENSVGYNMGFDAGFDVAPCLTNETFDSQNRQLFISDIKECYNDDENVEFKPNYIEFMVAAPGS